VDEDRAFQDRRAVEATSERLCRRDRQAGSLHPSLNRDCNHQPERHTPSGRLRHAKAEQSRRHAKAEQKLRHAKAERDLQTRRKQTLQLRSPRRRRRRRRRRRARSWALLNQIPRMNRLRSQRTRRRKRTRRTARRSRTRRSECRRQIQPAQLKLRGRRLTRHSRMPRRPLPGSTRAWLSPMRCSAAACMRRQKSRRV